MRMERRRRDSRKPHGTLRDTNVTLSREEGSYNAALSFNHRHRPDYWGPGPPLRALQGSDIPRARSQMEGPPY